MKKFEITKNMTRAFGKAGLTCKKYAPEALVIAGIVGVVTSAVMACKATTKVNDIIEETKENTHDLHLVATAAGLKEATDEFSNEDIRKIDILSEKEDVKNYTAQDLKKDTTIIYTQTAVKFIKLYGPSVVLGALSITSILASNNILRKRNVALAAAYATVDKGFKEYRSRVVERFGKDIDRELKYNIQAQEIEETTKTAQGTATTVKKSIEVADVNEHSDYARFFDELCTGWKRDAEYNLMFLKHQQNYANEKLQKQVLGDEQPVTCRYADLLEPEFEKTKAKLGDIAKCDEDVLSYIAFPQVAEKFFEARRAKEENVAKYTIVEA